MSDPESNPIARQHQWDASQASPDETWVQKRRLAAAMRLVIERLRAAERDERERRTI